MKKREVGNKQGKPDHCPTHCTESFLITVQGVETEVEPSMFLRLKR